ncbi:MAG: MMPL family transporter [Sphingobacteriaceae bacterium]|nr:MMPL family transporter [Sphingobacteriaceae bacterium]
MLLSFVVVIIFLWLSFRSIYGVVVPVIIVLVSILWTLGIMKFTGKSIDIMTVMLPTMMFVAGMSDVVHFFTKYFEEVAKGTPKAQIYPLILKEVGFPTFLTLVTTVVGFLSLLFSSITPVRDFGIYTSIGVVVAFILSYTFLPALLYFFTPKKLVTVHGTNNRTTNVMRNGLFWIFRNQKTILVITAVVMVLSVIGMFKIKVNNILLEDLSDKIKIKRDFNFFDENYSGVRPFEVQITLKDKTKKVWDRDVLLEINKVDEFIKKEYGAGFILSLPQIVKSIHRSMGDSYSMPNDTDYVAIKEAIVDNKKNRDLKQLINADGDQTKISAKTPDMGSSLIAEHNKNLFVFIEKM